LHLQNRAHQNRVLCYRRKLGMTIKGCDGALL
ncbi:hypothetical protein Tco_0582334, partial [Tanacetum coccineum]